MFRDRGRRKIPKIPKISDFEKVQDHRAAKSWRPDQISYIFDSDGFVIGGGVKFRNFRKFQIIPDFQNVRLGARNKIIAKLIRKIR